MTAIASPQPRAPDLDALTTAALAQLTHERGIDHATTVLYHAVRQHNLDFINTVDNLPLHDHQQINTHLLIAPAAFYREHPKYGGDGRALTDAAKAFHIPTEIIPTLSTGSVTQNAAIIQSHLESQPDHPLIIASLSKGSADLRIALERAPHLAKKIRFWINLSGLTRGTPISSSLLGSRWWQKGLLKGYLAYTRAHPALVSELSSDPNSLLGQPPQLPQNLTIINILGFPLTHHLAGNSKTRHARMAHLGPNDGTALLRDSLLPNSLTYPLFAADHFLKSPATADLFHRLFLYAQGAT